jgi:hypothetical protein
MTLAANASVFKGSVLHGTRLARRITTELVRESLELSEGHETTDRTYRDGDRERRHSPGKPTVRANFGVGGH